MGNIVPPFQFDVRNLHLGYVIREDENGDGYILCENGRIVAANPESGGGGALQPSWFALRPRTNDG